MTNDATYDRFAPGTRVSFRRTNGDTTIGYSFGTVLATGRQVRERYAYDVINRPIPSMMEDGAVIAWAADHYSAGASRATADGVVFTSFVPFWNERLQPISKLANGHEVTS
jgi:hypothetical protein